VHGQPMRGSGRRVVRRGRRRQADDEEQGWLGWVPLALAALAALGHACDARHKLRARWRPPLAPPRRSQQASREPAPGKRVIGKQASRQASKPQGKVRQAVTVN
jgi:hypothetical protein